MKGGKSLGSTRHWQPVRGDIVDGIHERTLVSRRCPQAADGGLRGPMTAHSASAMSLAQRSPSRGYSSRAIPVQATLDARCRCNHERIAADGITQPASLIV